MLEDAYRRRTLFTRFYRQPEWSEGGLMLGAETCLLPSHEDPMAEAGERLLAILSAVGQRDVDRAVLAHVDAARRHWRRGDKALAQLRLAYAGLPTVDARGGFRAFLADYVLACGLSPAALRKELGFGDCGVARKYSDAQPRVPAGSGRESGRWTSDDDAPVVEGRSADAGARVRTAFLDDRRNIDAETRSEDKAKETFGTETIENEVAHGHPIPLLQDGPFGAPLPGAVMTSPKQRAAPGRSPSGGAVPLENSSSNDDRFRLCPRPQTDRGAKDEFSRLYQEYVGTLVNPGLDPRVSGLLAYKFSTPIEKDVYIDHCNYKTGNLVEDKGHYAAAHEPGFFQDIVREDWIKQAQRQLEVAQYFGRPLEWWFYEKKSMELAQDWFEKAGIKGIIFKHVDYPGDDQWPYPPDATWAKGRQK